MSREQKTYATQPARMPPLPVKPPEEVTAQEKADVALLLARGESGPALDQAKRIHKRCHTSDSESLLLEAYLARIPALADRGLENEAKSLMQLVHERYPAQRERLRSVVALFASGGAAINDLLQPLNDESLPPERRAAIFKSIRCRITDLAAIADSPVLLADHPLKRAAAALVKAFEAVTSRPVADAELALLEISRQSPLAPWKMLVRAMAAFYRHEDSVCEKCLAAIEPESAAVRLVPALRTLLGHQQTLTPAAATLVNQAGGTLDALRSSLEKLDRLLDRKDQSESLRQIRTAVAECEKSCPDVLQQLKQHIFIRSAQARLKRDRLSQALGHGGVLPNAYFWRLLAHATEQIEPDPDVIFFVCAIWEQFRRHAVHEKWFPEKGPEAAAVYLHIVDLLLRIHPEDAQAARFQFSQNSKAIAMYYEGQPAEIRALMQPQGKPDLYMLYPGEAFARACQADPCAENFQRWFAWTRREQPRMSENVAKIWLAHLPNDVKPLLHLMASAEERGAFRLAFDYMQQAEMLDGLNPEVRKARLRLLLSMATRHLQQKKTRLAWPELNQIAALPQTQQGDRRAYVAALNWIGCMILSRNEEAAKEYNQIAEVLKNDPATRIVLRGAARACKFKVELPEPAPLENEPLAPAVGRACALGEDLGLPFEIPPQLEAQILRELSSNGAAVDFLALSALGEAALHTENHALAYAASTAGLAGSAANHARFLFLRARALPDWEALRQDDCVNAAAELARRQRDHDLLDRIGRWREEVMGPFGSIPTDLSMSTEKIEEIVSAEKSKAALAVSPPSFKDEVPCDCPKCRASQKHIFNKFEEQLEEMIDQFGADTVGQALEDIIFGSERKPNGGKRKRRR